MGDSPMTGGVTSGRIVLGDFEETFEASLEHWGVADYRRSWRDAVGRIVNDTGPAALVTSMVDPAVANFIRWWPLYRVGAEVLVHEHMLMVDELSRPVDLANLFELVPEYRSASEAEGSVSEWRLPIGSFQAFLDSGGARR